jgi:hypothetical protein
MQLGRRHFNLTFQKTAVAIFFLLDPPSKKKKGKKYPKKGTTFSPKPYFQKKFFNREKKGLGKKTVPFLGYFFFV